MNLGTLLFENCFVLCYIYFDAMFGLNLGLFSWINGTNLHIFRGNIDLGFMEMSKI